MVVNFFNLLDLSPTSILRYTRYFHVGIRLLHLYKYGYTIICECIPLFYIACLICIYLNTAFFSLPKTLKENLVRQKKKHNTYPFHTNIMYYSCIVVAKALFEYYSLYPKFSKCRLCKIYACVLYYNC